jgi:hypothetical protein
MPAYTNWYFNNVAAPYTPPAWRGSWDLDGSVSIALDPIKFGGVTSFVDKAETSATNPFRVGVLRAVSRRLSAQTISGTVNMIVGVRESSFSADFYTRLHIYVVNTADGSVLGTLLTGYEESAGGGGVEWSASGPTGKALQAAQALTPVVVPDNTNYRLVVELGYIAYNAVVTSFVGRIAYGTRTGLQPLADLTAGFFPASSRSAFLTFSTPIEMASDVVSNLNPESAQVIGPTLPLLMNTSDLHESGFTYTGWFKYTPVSGPCEANVIGVWVTGVGSYDPVTLAYPQDFSFTATSGIETPFGFPVVFGNDYYLEVRPNTTSNPTPAVATIDIVAAPRNTSVTGGILVNNDTVALDFPATILSPTTGNVVQFLPQIPAGEAGDVLENGILFTNHTAGNVILLFDATLTLITSVAFDIGSSPAIRAQRTLNRFYVGQPSNPAVVKVYSSAGVELSSHTMTGNNSIDGIAANNAGTILYHARDVGNPIRRWDLVGNADLADLAAGIPDVNAGYDILVLKDGTILVSFVTEVTGEFIVRRYLDDGTLLNTYAIAATTVILTVTIPRLAYALDDPASFWVWFHLTAPNGGIARFQNIRISDGAVLSSVDSTLFIQGRYNGPLPLPADPDRFGVAMSCYFAILPMEVADCGGGGGGCPGLTGSPRTDGLPYGPPTVAPCGGLGILGSPRTGV